MLLLKEKSRMKSHSKWIEKVQIQKNKLSQLSKMGLQLKLIHIDEINHYGSILQTLELLINAFITN